MNLFHASHAFWVASTALAHLIINVFFLLFHNLTEDKPAYSMVLWQDVGLPNFFGKLKQISHFTFLPCLKQ